MAFARQLCRIGNGCVGLILRPLLLYHDVVILEVCSLSKDQVLEHNRKNMKP